METLQRKSPNEIIFAPYQCIFLLPLYNCILLSYSSMVQHLQVFIFQTIEVLTELKQVCVLSKNSFKEKKKNQQIDVLFFFLSNSKTRYLRLFQVG